MLWGNLFITKAISQCPGFFFLMCGHRCSVWAPLLTRDMPHLQAVSSHTCNKHNMKDCHYSILYSKFLYGLTEKLQIYTCTEEKPEHFIVKTFFTWVCSRQAQAPPKTVRQFAAILSTKNWWKDTPRMPFNSPWRPHHWKQCHSPSTCLVAFSGCAN
jgi:hypothetical protein